MEKPSTRTRSMFFAICVAESKKLGEFRIHHCAMRCLQDIIDGAEGQEETVPVGNETLFAGLEDMKRKATSNRKRENVYRADIEAYFAPSAPTDEDEIEWECPDDLNAEKFHGVRKILGMLVEDGKAFFMVDWKQSFEKRSNLPVKMIIAFKKQRRMIVEKAYIEAEAIEAGASKKRRTA